MYGVEDLETLYNTTADTMTEDEFRQVAKDNFYSDDDINAVIEANKPATNYQVNITSVQPQQVQTTQTQPEMPKPEQVQLPDLAQVWLVARKQGLSDNEIAEQAKQHGYSDEVIASTRKASLPNLNEVAKVVYDTDKPSITTEQFYNEAKQAGYDDDQIYKALQGKGGWYSILKYKEKLSDEVITGIIDNVVDSRGYNKIDTQKFLNNFMRLSPEQATQYMEYKFGKRRTNKEITQYLETKARQEGITDEKEIKEFVRLNYRDELNKDRFGSDNLTLDTLNRYVAQPFMREMGAMILGIKKAYNDFIGKDTTQGKMLDFQTSVLDFEKSLITDITGGVDSPTAYVARAWQEAIIARLLGNRLPTQALGGALAEYTQSRGRNKSAEEALQNGLIAGSVPAGLLAMLGVYKLAKSPNVKINPITKFQDYLADNILKSYDTPEARNELYLAMNAFAQNKNNPKEFLFPAMLLKDPNQKGFVASLTNILARNSVLGAAITKKINAIDSTSRKMLDDLVDTISKNDVYKPITQSENDFQNSLVNGINLVKEGRVLEYSQLYDDVSKIANSVKVDNQVIKDFWKYLDSDEVKKVIRGSVDTDSAEKFLEAFKNRAIDQQIERPKDLVTSPVVGFIQTQPSTVTQQQANITYNSFVDLLKNLNEMYSSADKSTKKLYGVLKAKLQNILDDGVPEALEVRKLADEKFKDFQEVYNKKETNAKKLITFLSDNETGAYEIDKLFADKSKAPTNIKILTDEMDYLSELSPEYGVKMEQLKADLLKYYIESQITKPLYQFKGANYSAKSQRLNAYDIGGADPSYDVVRLLGGEKVTQEFAAAMTLFNKLRPTYALAKRITPLNDNSWGSAIGSFTKALLTSPVYWLTLNTRKIQDRIFYNLSKEFGKVPNTEAEAIKKIERFNKRIKELSKKWVATESIGDVVGD